MLFNSIDFAIFLPVVFMLYWFAAGRKYKIQNLFLLISSYFFYASWDRRFLILLISISLMSYLTGLLIDRSKSRTVRKIYMITGVVISVGTLAIFKYFNFFTDSFINFLSIFNFTVQKPALNIILPVGISFYIFLSLSYIIDIYQNKLKAYRNIIDVLLTLSYFPIILAGPIQRQISLLPQLQKERFFNYDIISGGLRQILWGLFMKIVIADNCAVYANDIFNNYVNYNGSTLLIGAVFYSVQIYADFAGYSEIAIGVSKLFGIELMRNFAFPYFAKDITEFWRRWHISLTTWFRDYVFLPISFFVSRKIPSERVLGVKTDLIIYSIGIVLTWLLTGLWHGANYTFIVWGLFHGTFLIIYHVLKKPRKKILRKFHIKQDNIVLVSFERVFTLLLIVISWIFFRAESISHALAYISGIFSQSIFSSPAFAGSRRINPVIIFGIIFFTIEWFCRNRNFALENLGLNWKRFYRWTFYILLILSIYFYGIFSVGIEFIYFQF